MQNKVKICNFRYAVLDFLNEIDNNHYYEFVAVIYNEYHQYEVFYKDYSSSTYTDCEI